MEEDKLRVKTANLILKMLNWRQLWDSKMDIACRADLVAANSIGNTALESIGEVWIGGT